MENNSVHGEIGAGDGEGRNDSVWKSRVTMGKTKQPLPNQVLLLETLHERGRENGIDYALLVQMGLIIFLEKEGWKSLANVSYVCIPPLNISAPG